MGSKDKVRIYNEFDDVSECTEYYLDELKKLDLGKRGGFLSKKEHKKLHNDEMFFFNTSMEILKLRFKTSTKMDKVTTKEAKEEFQKEHNVGFIQKTTKAIKISTSKVGIAIGSTLKLMLPKSKRVAKVDVLTEEEAKRLSQGHTDSSSPALPEGEKREEDIQQDENNNEDKDLSQGEEIVD